MTVTMYKSSRGGKESFGAAAEEAVTRFSPVIGRDGRPRERRPPRSGRLRPAHTGAGGDHERRDRAQGQDDAHGGIVRLDHSAPPSGAGWGSGHTTDAAVGMGC